ncbi:MAG: cation:proton antiporter [Candidatus Thermoplasmatota archaeon]|nr:cation:proton antiporter [Candidatus Thermoplasmatota archaeon]
MVAEDVLVKFFVILALLFFLPKVVGSLLKIPDVLTELIIGIILGIAIPSYFFIDDMLTILATIGIVTLFVYSGMDVETNFIVKNKKFFMEHIILHILIFVVVGLVIELYLHLSLQISFLVSLALTTPSASFILSSIKTINKERKQWIESKALSGEITGIILMVILLNLSDLTMLIFSLLTLVLLISILPAALEFLYKKIFSKIIGCEFSFIFVVAMISAFITEYVGVHFLVGAFIAGFVAKQFICDIVKDESYVHCSEHFGQQLIIGFGFFALIFTPFYFFTTGLNIKRSMFSSDTLIFSVLICIAVVLLRIGVMSLHRIIRIKEKITTAIDINAMCVPTLVFTFVITEILLIQYQINTLLYSILMLYGIFTTIIGSAFFMLAKRNKNIVRGTIKISEGKE